MDLKSTQGAHTSHLRALSKNKFIPADVSSAEPRIIHRLTHPSTRLPFRNPHRPEQNAHDLRCEGLGSADRPIFNSHSQRALQARCASIAASSPRACKPVMGEIYEDRRQEPRFSTAGKYSLQMARSGNIEGRILDLSLNGAMLERTSNADLQAGTRHRLVLEFTGQTPFQGDALIVYAGGNRIGIEFYDMDPQNFAALSVLIEALTRANR
jgi:PilZ domain